MTNRPFTNGLAGATMRMHPEVGGRVRTIQSLPVLLMAGLVGCDATKADIEAGPILGDTGITLDGDGDGDGDGGPPIPTGASVGFALGTVHEGAPELGEFPGLVGVPNLDDDDQSGSQSCWARLAVRLETMTSRAPPLRRVKTTSRSRLMAQGSVYADGDLVLGDGGGSTHAPTDGQELLIEFQDFLDQGRLIVEDATADQRFEIALTASPLFFNHHLQDAEETMAMYGGQFGYHRHGLHWWLRGCPRRRLLHGSAIRYEYDVWVQDEFEFAYATAPDAHLDIVFDTHRNDKGHRALVSMTSQRTSTSGRTGS